MGEGKSLVGVDIGSSSIKVCEIKQGRGGALSLLRFGFHPLPPQTIVDGHVMNSGAVVDGLEKLFHKVRRRDVALRISGHSVIIKKIAMPIMTSEELREQIGWEAEQHIPFDVSDVELDYQVLSERADEGQMEVLLVAAKKEEINDLIGLAAQAQLRPRVVDLDAFCLQNCFTAAYGEPDPAETVVLLHVGASLTTLNILSGGTTAFTRDIANGGSAMTEEIQRQLSVSQEEAEAYKCGSAGGIVPQEVPRIVAEVVETLAGEIQRSLDFFLATGGAERRLDRVVLSGGVANMASLREAVERRAGVPCQLLDPTLMATPGAQTVGASELTGRGSEATVAFGLALRRERERRL